MKDIDKVETKMISEISVNDLDLAEIFWIKEAQRQFEGKLEKAQFRKLCPKVDGRGVIIVGANREMVECNMEQARVCSTTKGQSNINACH